MLSSRYHAGIMSNYIFKKYLDERSSEIDAHLRTYFHSGSHPDMDLYLYDPLSKYSENGGKRHRPLITLLACSAVGGDEKQALAAGAAIEHFHTAALIHDDIADDSQLRRGEPCMHITLGEGLAINAGDLALSLVTGTVINDDSLPDDIKLRVLRELVDMTTRTIEGQAMDIGWAQNDRFDISVQDYLCMAQHKTAFYSGGVPLAIGAIIGGGTEEQISALRAYGMSTGLAFQLQDDLLNLVGKKEAANKDYRSDITEGKRTMIAVHALANAPAAQRDELLQLLSSKETDPARLERAVQIMQDAGSIDYVRDYAIRLAHQGQDELKRVLPASISRKLLLSMGDFFVSRLN